MEKSMKNLLLTLSVMFYFYGCSGENASIEEPPTLPVNPKEYIVSFGFTGEITSIEESPLSRAVSNDLYGVQVYSMPATSTEDNYKPYAYGVFDDRNMTVRLLDGYKYKFVSTMVIDGKMKITTNNYPSGPIYYSPFTTNSSANIASGVSASFVYSASIFLSGLGDGTAYLKDDGIYHRPNVDRYYGEFIDYVPSDNGKVAIKMNRVSFGVKMITEGLTEGRIIIALPKSPLMYIAYPSTEVQDIFSHPNSITAWSLLDSDYAETIPVSISWEKSDGANVPLVTQDITFKRNKLTTITVKVNDNSINNRVDISNEDTPMGDGGNITIDTGEGTETEVDPKP